MRCNKKLGGRNCKKPARFKGKCTVHFIKSKSYKGKSHNIRRKPAKKRKNA